MHAVHHTTAVVLKSIQTGEANKRVWLFTKEFGLVVAMVQGVRKSAAKLQSHISDYSFIAADLVKGREVWRLISAQIQQSPLFGKTRDPLARAYVRTLTFLTRFLIEEGTHEELFEHVEDCAAVLEEGNYDAHVFDAVSIWKMLVMLGYIAPDVSEVFIMEQSLREVLTSVSDSLHARLVSEAKQAIIESHL